ncbi:MAG TPA: SPOR domain-containing protein [Salinimicrobium sp.]|nr:SPOR domain-containing protein [Salinimicrobium sp.]
MAITNYISELLYRYECVVLPGFGAFITHRQSARIQVKDNQFFPPQKSVSFNQQLTKNDGLLANHLVELEKISFKTAVEKIDFFVRDLQSILQKEQSVKLEHLGSFSLTEEGKLQFEPAAEMNYLKEAFGLSSFNSPEVLRESYKQQAVALEEKAPIAFTPERRKTRPYLKYAAIGLLALGLSGFTGLNIYSSQVKEHNLAEQQKAASALENQIQTATFAIENPLPAITFKVAKQEGNYHIVAGAFREEENALKKVEQLKKEGFLARKMEVNRYGLHQVLYSSYESRREAINALWKVKRTSNPGAWLLVKEL